MRTPPLPVALPGLLAALALSPAGCPRTAEPVAVAPVVEPEAVLPTDQALTNIARHRLARDAGSEIVPFLRHGDPEVRVAALLALGQMGRPEALDPIAFRLQDDVPIVRDAAAQALSLSWSWRADDDAARLLIEDRIGAALTSALETEEDPRTRAQIALAMGHAAGGDVWPALQRLLSAGEREERLAALEAMAMLGRRGMATPIDGAVLDPLLPAMVVDDPQVQWWGAYLLLRCPLADDPGVRDRAHQALALAASLDGDDERLAVVARALGAVGHPEAVSALERVLDRAPPPPVRQGVARGLGHLVRDGDAGAVTALCRLAADPDDFVREIAAGGLGDASLPAAPATATPDDGADGGGEAGDDAADRVAAAPPHPDAVEVLCALLSDPAAAVREAAVTSLGRLQPPDLLPLLEAVEDDPDPWVRGARAAALVPRRDDEAVGALDETLRSADHSVVRLAALTALAGTDHPLARPALLAALHGASAHEAEIAVGAFTPPPDDQVVAALVEAYDRWGGFDGEPVRLGIVSAVAGAPPAPPGWLDRALEDPSLPVRRAAARAIRQTGRHAVAHPDPVPAVTDPWLGADAVRQATIHTERGDIRVELYPRRAPATVASFAHLALSGAYDDTAFHRVVPAFVIQGGDPEGTGWGGPGYRIPSEFNAVPYEPGTLGMARGDVDTEGSQWFITHDRQPHLTRHYTVFGRVVEGMDVVRAIRRGDRVTSIDVAGEVAPETLQVVRLGPAVPAGGAAGSGDESGGGPERDEPGGEPGDGAP